MTLDQPNAFRNRYRGTNNYVLTTCIKVGFLLTIHCGTGKVSFSFFNICLLTFPFPCSSINTVLPKLSSQIRYQMISDITLCCHISRILLRFHLRWFITQSDFIRMIANLPRDLMTENFTLLSDNSIHCLVHPKLTLLFDVKQFFEMRQVYTLTLVFKSFILLLYVRQFFILTWHQTMFALWLNFGQCTLIWSKKIP